MERLLEEIADLSEQGLTGAAVAISFCRRLTQPIQERVHPTFEYWGHRDPTRGHERKVSPGRDRKPGRPHHGGGDPGQGLPQSPLPEAANQCLSLLEPCRVVSIRSGLFPLFLLCFSECTHWDV